jgi:hypothetical protein
MQTRAADPSFKEPLSLINSSHSLIHAHREQWIGSVVFIDTNQLEIVLWNHCMPILFQNGALTIHDLNDESNWLSRKRLERLFQLSRSQIISNSQTQNIEEEKMNEPYRAVFLISHLNTENERQIRKCIHKYAFVQVEVLPAYSNLFAKYYQTICENYWTYEDLTEKITLWILEAQKLNQKEKFNENALNPIVNIHHMPLHFAAITNDLFLIPACSQVFPALGSSVPTPHNTRLSSRTSVSPIIFRLSDQKRSQYIQLSHALRDFCEAANLCGEIYSIGESSHFIAENLQSLITDYPIQCKKHRASFFIFDRTLDLVSPMAHADNLVDEIVDQMATRLGITTPLIEGGNYLEKSFFSKLSSILTDVDPSFQFKTSMTGLFHNGSPLVISLLRKAIENNSKDALSLINQELLKLFTMEEKEKILKDIKFHSNERQLETIFSHILETPQLTYRNLELLPFISVLLDVIFKINKDPEARYKSYMSTAQLLINISENTDKLLSGIREMIGKNQSDSIKEIFKLLVLVYSLAAPDATFLDEDLMEDIINALLTVKQKEKLGWISEKLEKALNDQISYYKAQEQAQTFNKGTINTNQKNQSVSKWGNDDDDEDWAPIPESSDEEEETNDEEKDEWADFDPFKDKNQKESKDNNKLICSTASSDEEDEVGWDNDSWDDIDFTNKKKNEPKPVPKMNIRSNPFIQQLRELVSDSFGRLHETHSQRSSLQVFRYVN